MAVQTPVYTASQQASAARLLAGALTWVRGTRKSDGLAFVLFPSSRAPKAGQAAVGYYTSSLGCTCPGFFQRGFCSHFLAVSQEAEQVSSAAFRAEHRYEDLYAAEDEYSLTAAF